MIGESCESSHPTSSAWSPASLALMMLLLRWLSCALLSCGALSRAHGGSLDVSAMPRFFGVGWRETSGGRNSRDGLRSPCAAAWKRSNVDCERMRCPLTISSSSFGSSSVGAGEASERADRY